MTRLNQMQKMFDLRKVKVDGLMLAVAAAQSAQNRAQAEVQAANKALEDLHETTTLDFEELFAATGDTDDPHSRLQAVNRTLLQNRRAQEAARRRTIEAQLDLEAAVATLRSQVQDLNAAQAQLDAVEALLFDETQMAQRLAEDLADETVLEDLAGLRSGRVQ